MRTKMLILLLALVLLHVIVIFAGFIAPCDPGEQNRELPYSPPTQLHFVDGSGFHLRPFVYASMLVVDSYQEDRTHEYPVHLFVTGGNYTVLGMFRSNVHLFRVDEPAHIFLFGADGFGRDEFWRFRFLPAAPARFPGNIWSSFNSSCPAGSTVCCRRGDSIVLRTGRQRAGAELGQHAEHAAAI